MDYKAKQKALDEAKWLDSEKQGKDTCGEYEYCACCDKNEEYPCARASAKSEAKTVKSAAPKAKSATAKKTATAKSAGAKTAGTKTAAAKKTTAKK